MIEPFIPLINGSVLNTKAGFKLIYNTMLTTKDFHKAVSIIFKNRTHNIVSVENMITIIKARYNKEILDYSQARINNNSINN